MRFVIDASVTLGFFFEEDDFRLVEQVADILTGDARAAAPAIWWFEIRNAMLIGIRRKRTTEDLVRQFLGQLAFAAIDIAEQPDDGRVLDLAPRHRPTFYDACYLELAVRTNYPLATLDRALVEAAKAENVRLIGTP